MVPHNKQQLLVLWVIWASLFGGVFMYQFVLGGGIPTGRNAEMQGVHFAVGMAACQIAVATAVRWLLVPRAKTAGQVLVSMIVGLALSESVEFYGLFLVPADQPSTKLGLWVLAILSCLQFAPLYAMARETAADAFRNG